MANPDHANWLREGVKSWNQRRRKVNFKPDLSGLRFFEFLPPDFRDAPKTSRFFEGINLTGANLINADLSDLNFRKGKFSEADLTRADLSLSNFSQANFTRSTLKDVKASHAIFDGSTFEETDINGGDYETATFDGVILIGSSVEKDVRERIAASSENVFRDKLAYRDHQAGQHYIASKVLNQSAPKSANTKDDRTKENIYDVFYATNRDPIFTRGELTGYGSKNTNEIRYGVCEVTIPESPTLKGFGIIGTILWKKIINRKPKELFISSTIGLNEELYWDYLESSAKKMRVKANPTIFVHGFNTSFQDAVIRSAKIGHGIGIGQGIGLFSWPSQGKLTAYHTDEAAAEASRYLLAEFIEKFVKKNPNRKINIIAHSMGCRCVAGALEILSAGKKSVLRKVDQIILAAADIDANIMPHQGQHAINYCGRITSYISDLDVALNFSSWMHGFPRIGHMPPVFVLKGMDTIEVNSEQLGSYYHGYVETSRAVLSDIFSILSKNTPPNERHALEKISSGNSCYWRMKA